MDGRRKVRFKRHGWAMCWQKRNYGIVIDEIMVTDGNLREQCVA